MYNRHKGCEKQNLKKLEGNIEYCYDLDVGKVSLKEAAASISQKSQS